MISKPIKIKWFKRKPDSQNLSEIYQQTGVLFSFVSSSKDGASQCHEWVKCRDFLHDAVRYSIPIDPTLFCNIYGFNFDPSYNPLVDMKKMRMLVTKAQTVDKTVVDFKRKMKSAVRLLNHYETMAGVGKTRIKAVKPDDGNSHHRSIFLFTGPVMWMSSPYLVSMYSFLIRLGDKELKFKDDEELIDKLNAIVEAYNQRLVSDNDSMYLVHTWNRLSMIIKNRDKLFSRDKKISFYLNKDSDMGIQAFHNYSGIYSLASAHTASPVINEKIKELIAKETPKNAKKETNTG